jgi:DNA-binding transcriptional LysR family regulator
MEWDKLRIFYEVAKSGSMTQASKIINISQPALSRTIQMLEHQLKTSLFNRESRGVSLTKHGELLYSHAEKMYLEADAARKIIKESHCEENEVEGLIEILTNHALAYSWLTHYIPGYLNEFPKMRCRIHCNDAEVSFDKTDAVICPYIAHKPELVQIYLYTFQIKLFASIDYLKEFGIPNTPEDLDNHRLIVAHSGPYLYGNSNSMWVLQLGRKEGHIREPYIEINSSHGMLNLARKGLGIVALGKNHPELEGVTNLVEILPNVESPKIDVYYVYPKQLSNSKKVTSFGNYLKETLELENFTLNQKTFN